VASRHGRLATNAAFFNLTEIHERPFTAVYGLLLASASTTTCAVYQSRIQHSYAAAKPPRITVRLPIPLFNWPRYVDGLLIRLDGSPSSRMNLNVPDIEPLDFSSAQWTLNSGTAESPDTFAACTHCNYLHTPTKSSLVFSASCLQIEQGKTTHAGPTENHSPSVVHPQTKHIPACTAWLVPVPQLCRPLRILAGCIDTVTSASHWLEMTQEMGKENLGDNGSTGSW